MFRTISPWVVFVIHDEMLLGVKQSVVQRRNSAIRIIVFTGSQGFPVAAIAAVQLCNRRYTFNGTFVYLNPDWELQTSYPVLATAMFRSCDERLMIMAPGLPAHDPHACDHRA